MRLSSVLLCFMISLVLLSTAEAKTGKITLLAVSQGEDGAIVGTTADLFLEIKNGRGRVFIESFPLTKIDTQISTRFAKDIACSYLEMDCSHYDFFYTVRSSSSIIGGPSAGAAISVLTSAVLLDLDYDPQITITGTINSGGVIGPVGGVTEKVKAAEANGLTTVLVPTGEQYLLENITFSGSPKIVFVSTLDDAMFEFTGRRKHYSPKNFTINPDYILIMEGLASNLCLRADESRSRAFMFENNGSAFRSFIADGDNLTARARVAYSNDSYYTAASHCFGAGVSYHRAILVAKNSTSEEVLRTIDETREEIDSFEQLIEKKTLRTITDLQAYMVVKERIIEARDNLDRSALEVDNNRTGYNDLAFGIERLESARLWADFFGTEGKEFVLDRDVLSASCLAKIAEAMERYHYSTAYLPSSPRDTLQMIKRARDDYDNGDYALCLFKAAKAKAESDIILSAVSVDQSRIVDLVNQKLAVAEIVIAEASEKDIFPIVGYSYYEFSKDLLDSDRFSALLYAEYALELSNFDVYFERQYRNGALRESNHLITLVFLLGFLTGTLFTAALFLPKKR